MCGKRILEGESAVLARGYMSEGQAHLDCLKRAAIRAAMDAKPEVEVI